MTLFLGSIVTLQEPVVRYIIAPIASRLIWPLLLYKTFGLAPISAKFGRSLEEIAVRPSQLQTSVMGSTTPALKPFGINLRHSQLPGSSSSTQRA